MPEAVIVSTARTPLAKSWKGSFNMTHGATLGGHVDHVRSLDDVLRERREQAGGERLWPNAHPVKT